MRIGEICQLTLLSKDTIRFYEKLGLLSVERSKSQYNNYKEYTWEHVHRLQFIIKAKQFGFTLNEIAQLLELQDSHGVRCSILERKVEEKLAEIDREIQTLTDMKHLITRRLQEAQSLCASNRPDDNCKILVSHS